MDLVALSNGLHGSVQMDSVALFSWIGWLRHHGIFKKVQNKHVQFQHEWLYIFGKEISLMKRYEEKSEVVPLYIKFNMIENKFVIVISFHKQKYPLVYYFR